MPYNNLIRQDDGAVATITIHRPEKLNALNRQTLEELYDCLMRVSQDELIKVVVLTGAGDKAFVAGADIGELKAMTAIEAEKVATFGQAVMNLLENLGKPVIAAVGGFALGGGCELAMACTFRLASNTARLGLPETGLGLIPGFGGTQRLPRLVGRGRAMELILTGRMISADEACAMGLVNTVYPPEELAPAVMEIAKSIAEKSASTLRTALKAVNEGLGMNQDSGCRLEAALFGVCGGSDDAHEGCQAFLEKRPPVFKNT